MRRPLVLALLLAALPQAWAQLPEPVSKLMAAAAIPEDAIGIVVMRGNTSVLSHMAARPMQPASTMKLVTTLVGLEQLGPVFRGRTELRSSAEVVKGVLKGDLVLRGGADADMSGDELERMLQSLRNQGIKRIDGKLVIDRQLFNPTRTDVGIPPFDESPEAYYNVIPDALLVNKNMLLLDMRSNDKALQLSMEPTLEKVSVMSNMTLIDADCAKWEDGWKLPEVVRERGGKLKVILNGSFPKNCARSNSINVIDRQEYVDRLFRRKWREVGGEIRGATVEGGTPPESRLLAAHVSRNLPEVVRDINKPSDNTLARTVFLSLGSLEADPLLGSRPITGVATETTLIRSDLAVRNWMRGHQIDDTGLVTENGSGLSRLEKISPQQMAGLLQAGLRSHWAPEFQASLPIVAVDGTMRKRLKDSPAASRARLKTGTLRNVVAVAGYVTDASGQQCVVVAMINSDNVKDGKGRAVLDALVDWVARLER
jgi:D-alanyl-D-alanine carboxypeptidase/D-alanyl-D-alanine-endopeptidase (penicillin-binding protein 4)